MSTHNHTAITTGAAANASTINTPLGTLDAAIGNLTTLTTTAKTSAVAAINEVDANADAANAAVGTLASLTTTAKSSAVAAINEVDANADAALAASAGGAAIGDQLLAAWTESNAYEVTSATYTDGILASATVNWPDSSAGSLTVTDVSAEFNSVNGYTITHTDSGKTVTQAAVTRDADGNITTKPALSIA